MDGKMIDWTNDEVVVKAFNPELRLSSTNYNGGKTTYFLVNGSTGVQVTASSYDKDHPWRFFRAACMPMKLWERQNNPAFASPAPQDPEPMTEEEEDDFTAQKMDLANIFGRSIASRAPQEPKKKESLYEIPAGCICMGDGLYGMPCTASEHARLKSAPYGEATCATCGDPIASCGSYGWQHVNHTGKVYEHEAQKEPKKSAPTVETEGEQDVSARDHKTPTEEFRYRGIFDKIPVSDVHRRKANLWWGIHGPASKNLVAELFAAHDLLAATVPPESAGGEQVTELPQLEITNEDNALSGIWLRAHGQHPFKFETVEFFADSLASSQRQLFAAKREIETLRKLNQTLHETNFRQAAKINEIQGFRQSLAEDLLKMFGYTSMEVMDNSPRLRELVKAALLAHEYVEAELASLRAAQPKTEVIEGELSACPFCGSKDVFSERSDYSSSYIMCNNCGTHGPTECQESDEEDTPGEHAAKVAWNRRVAKSVDAPNGQGWCSSCDKMHDCARPLCPKCNDYLIFASDDTAGPVDAGGNYVANREQRPTEVRFDNGRRVFIRTDDQGPYLEVAQMKPGEAWLRNMAEAEDVAGFFGVGLTPYNRACLDVIEAASRTPEAGAEGSKWKALAQEAYELWDSDKDSKCGKLLRALSGYLPGYRADVDQLLASPAEAPTKEGK